MIQDSADPDPKDHVWKCIAVLNHKTRELNMDDVHAKEKLAQSDGEETWVCLDALRIQDSYPLITYAVKKKLTKQPNWK